MKQYLSKKRWIAMPCPSEIPSGSLMGSLKTRNDGRGFTVVELLVVIAVIAILAAVTIVSYTSIQTKAQFAKIQSDLSQMKTLIDMYYTDNGRYPVTGSVWFYSYNQQDTFIPGIVPTYAASLPRFTYGTANGGNCYVYRSSDGTAYKLIRLGQPSLSADEQALVPASMKDQYWATYADRYGYWSPGSTY